ncbi:MAG: PQQ-dependent sugar dehydrogenase, partial [Pseudomonadota bacterium]
MRFRSEARALAAAAAMIGLGASSGCAETDISTTAETSAGPARVEAMAGPFDQPWGFAFLPDGDVLVTEKGGALWRARPAPLSEGAARAKVAGAPEVAAGGQGGLLDVAVAPDFAQSGVIYLTYSERADGGLARTTAARARLAGGAEAPRLENLEPIFRQQPAV